MKLVSPKCECKTNLVETQQDIILSQRSLQLLMAPETNSPPARGNPKQIQTHKLVSTEPKVVAIMEPSILGSDQAMLKPPPQSSQNRQLAVETAKLKLSMGKIVELEKIKQLKQRSMEKQDAREDVVVCECGDKEEDGDMVGFIGTISFHKLTIRGRLRVKCAVGGFMPIATGIPT